MDVERNRILLVKLRYRQRSLKRRVGYWFQNNKVLLRLVEKWMLKQLIVHDTLLLVVPETLVYEVQTG